MSTTVTMGWEILDRMERAVNKVRERLLRSTSVLNQACIPYAVVGGHAVASWVSTVDEGAVRNTPDVDLLLYREDLPVATAAFEKAGFLRAYVDDVITFLDSPGAKPSEGFHLLFAKEKARREYPLPNPDITTVDDTAGFRVIALAELVIMKLLAHRLKDKVHIRDMIDVGLIDRTWLAKVPPVLSDRLQAILDNPEG
jgi:hypothetical protein